MFQHNAIQAYIKRSSRCTSYMHTIIILTSIWSLVKSPRAPHQISTSRSQHLVLVTAAYMMVADRGAGCAKRAGTGRQANHTAPAPARHQRARCAGAAAGQGAAAASGGRAGAGTRGHATIEPLRLVWLLPPPPVTRRYQN